MKQERFLESLVNLLLPLGLIFGLVLLLSLNVGAGTSGENAASPLESSLKLIAGYFAAGAEIAAAVVIGMGVIRGIWDYLRQLLSRSRHHVDATEGIRLKLGRVLSLGLEFTVASDKLLSSLIV